MSFVGQVVYQVYVDGVPYDNRPLVLDGQLDQEYGRHDMFFLRIEYPRTFPNINSLSIWPDDTPVRIVWGRKPDLNNWYGYVNHHETKSVSDSGTNVMQLTYVCIGTSMPLNVDKTRTWQSVSATYIAKKIARENGLRAVVTPLNYTLNYEVQTAESDFVFLNRIADKVGLRFWCSGGTLYMVAPDIALFGASKSTIPVFTHDKLLDQQDTVRKFELFQGKNLPGSVVANRVVFGIDKATGNLFSAVANPSVPASRTHIHTDIAVSSYHEAKSRMNAKQALSQFWIGARAQLFGNTLLYPGKLVTLQGLSLPGNMTGNWIVSSAKHLLLASGTGYTVLDRYMTDVELMRNTDSGMVLLNRSQPVRPEITTCSLNSKGLWITNSPGVITETVP